MQKIVCLCFIGLFFITCRNDTEVAQNSTINTNDYTVEIVTNVMDFVMSDTIQSGWQTYRYSNKSTDPHFFLIEKYPKGKGIKDARKEVLGPFQRGMNKITEGKPGEAGAEFLKLPEWYTEVQFLGGSGILSSGKSSITTVHLSPGTYVMECYMKMKGGIFHSAMGMMREFTVVEGSESIDTSKLVVDYTVSISSTEGITVSDSMFTAGQKLFKVEYIDQIVHENFVGHDVNLASITDKTPLDSLEQWMNWANPEGLLQNPPRGIEFLGGVNDMPGGSHGYFEVTLESGQDYVLVSEVPDTQKKNMLWKFSVQ